MKKAFFILCTLICIPSCIAPKKKIPHHTFDKTFAHQQTLCATQPEQKWWHQFNDPTLNKLIKQAIKTNYDIRIALEKIEQQRTYVSLKKAQLCPLLDTTLDVSKTGISKQLLQTSFISNNTIDFFNFGINAVWEVDFWGKIWRGKQAAICALQAQIEAMRLVYITLIADVAKTYVDICAFKQKYIILKKLLSVQKHLTALEMHLYNTGLANELPALKEQKDIINIKNQLLSIKEYILHAYHSLAILLGMNPTELYNRLHHASIPHINLPLAIGVPSDILRRRPDIRQAEQELMRAYELVGQAIAQWFPSFTLFGNIDTTSSTTRGWFASNSLTWSIGPSISMPLLYFGRIEAHIKEQESLKRQAALAYSQTVITALKEVENALVSYHATKQQQDFLHQKREYAIQEEKLLYDRYRSGLSNEQEYLIVQKNRLFIEFDLCTVEQAASTYVIYLYKAVGGGW